MAVYRRNLHFLVNAGSAHIQRTPENIREPKHILLYLVREIGDGCSHNDILSGIIWQGRKLISGSGLAHGEHDGFLAIAFQHIRGNNITCG